MQPTYEIDLTEGSRTPPGSVRTAAPLTQDPAVFWRWVNNMTRRAQGWALVALGGIVLVVGYMGIARQALIAKQLPYLASGGLGGLALVALGALFIVSEDLRHDTRRLDALEERVDHIEEMVSDLHSVLLTTASGGPRSPRTTTDDARRGGTAGQVMVLPSGQRFHRPGCALVQDKPQVTAISPEEAQRQRLSPCLVCEPELVPA